MSYAAIIVSILPSVEVLSRKAPVWCLPNACPHRGSALLPPNLSYQPIEITYSNRLLDARHGNLDIGFQQWKMTCVSGAAMCAAAWPVSWKQSHKGGWAGAFNTAFT